VRDEAKDANAALRTEMKDSIATLRAEIQVVRNDLTASIGALRIEMKDSFAKFHSSRTSQVAWMVTTVITATGVAFTVAKFFVVP
jgi:hypothetical protein